MDLRRYQIVLASAVTIRYIIEKMRIEKIELIGFKSFADRTIFHFHPGITCVVGPNGCGKSNIVDAFRWVLGEQSAKSLRGEKMEEVIFNGSTSKKPKGMADVTMTLSGLNGSSSSASEESAESVPDAVAVTRRLYRSGESEYMLNKNQCRLKDIRDLFLDTGLEVKSFSILEQDGIVQILNAKPLERRILIEEVAGVMKYNVRKKEALSKLESSRSNLQRVNDIISEVKKQINFLDRLARKAERYKKLTLEMHAIELKISKRDYQILKESFEKISQEYGLLKEEESLKKADLSKIENETEARRLALLEKEKALEQIQIKFQAEEKEISELEKSIAVAKTERDNHNEYLVKLHQQAEEFNKKKEEFSFRLNALETTEADLSSEIEKQKELLGDKAEFVKNAEEELQGKEDLLERKRREIFKLSEEVGNLRNDQSRLQSALENLVQRENSSLRDSESLKKALSELDSSLGDVESNLLEKNNEILLLKERKGVVLQEISATKSRIENLRETLSKLKEEFASYTSRLASLRELVFDDSARELLSDGNLSFNLVSSVSDVIEVDDQYERAIESALSEKVNSFILRTFDDIEKATQALKEKGLGRTAFIPADPPAVSEAAMVPEGCLGRAKDFIRTQEDFSGIARNLFENIFVVRDLKTALHLIASGNNFMYVTLEGDVVEPSGAVIAGEIRGVFRRKREIRELESAIEDKRRKIESVQSEVGSTQESIESKEIALRDIETAVSDREKEVSLLKMTSENYREEKERRSRKLAYLALELEQITAEKASTEQLLREKESEITSADARRTEAEQSGSSLQEELAREKTSLEDYRAEVTDIRLHMTSLRERAESVTKEKENMAREITENDRKRAYLSEEISSIQARIAQREDEISLAEEKIGSLVTVADSLRKEISGRKEVIDSENQELLGTEQGLKALRNQIDAVSQRVAELDIQKAEHKLKMEALYENVRQHFGLSLDTVEVEPLTEEDEKRLAELKGKIQELGPVNLGTIEEYEELRTRYEFLKSQQEDLNKSIAELEEAITRINVTTRKKLREAFDALKTKFSEVFLGLFGGGRAELVMTDENNILETGVDIIAQPPGKRLQNINLLSGGEKTLTALSLLFASFLLKPTPLCILDEADSALDEMNTGKFASLVKDLSKDTQFIVVTHNRNTMNVADYIYGITMEEAGISKVISMQLVEA